MQLMDGLVKMFYLQIARAWINWFPPDFVVTVAKTLFSPMFALTLFQAIMFAIRFHYKVF